MVETGAFNKFIICSLFTTARVLYCSFCPLKILFIVGKDFSNVLLMNPEKLESFISACLIFIIFAFLHGFQILTYERIEFLKTLVVYTKF